MCNFELYYCLSICVPPG